MKVGQKKTDYKEQDKLQKQRKNPKDEEKYLESITYREATKADINFVYDSWCKSSFRGNWKNHQDYNNKVGYTLTYLLKNCAQIVLAVNSADEDHIIGWVCFTDEPDSTEQPTLHYVYTKQSYRNQGVMTNLLRLVGFDMLSPIKTTTYTKMCDYFSDKLYRFEVVNE